MPSDWTTIGRVIAVNPARRELRIRPDKGCKRQFAGLTWLHVAGADGAGKRCRVDSVRECPTGFLVALASGTTRDSVAQMRGAAVKVAPEQLNCSTDEDLELSELVGLRVLDAQGTELGVIVEAFATPAHGVLEFKRPEGGHLLVPFIEEVVAGIDLEQGVVTVNDLTPYAVEHED